ncbi:MAG: hypothetical protein E6Q58_04220 [Niabella sp.]|nr:MAG: hypothetical protein E6Q58_04220 [Niabella sp.]
MEVLSLVFWPFTVSEANKNKNREIAPKQGPIILWSEQLPLCFCALKKIGILLNKIIKKKAKEFVIW